MTKVLISDTFRKLLQKLKVPEASFIKKLRVYKLISLKVPFYKIKLFSPALRGIVYYDSEKDLLIPVLLFKKSDKSYGFNLLLDDAIKNLLDKQFKKITLDIKNWDYKIYEI